MRIAKLLLVLAATTASLIVAAPKTEAVQGNLCSYYNSGQQLVGQRGVDCCGNPVNWGVTTNNYQCYTETCVWCPPEEM